MSKCRIVSKKNMDARVWLPMILSLPPPLSTPSALCLRIGRVEMRPNAMQSPFPLHPPPPQMTLSCGGTTWVEEMMVLKDTELQ